jgi:hypothetical protein
VDEHPQYRMWKDRLESEEALEHSRAARRALRDAARVSWQQAWVSYKARRGILGRSVPRPRWWDIVGWVRWLLRLHAPGRAG